jgi:hypothetical protein
MQRPAAAHGMLSFIHCVSDWLRAAMGRQPAKDRRRMAAGYMTTRHSLSLNTLQFSFHN